MLFISLILRIPNEVLCLLCIIPSDELPRPTKKPKILPGKEINEKSKKVAITLIQILLFIIHPHFVNITVFFSYHHKVQAAAPIRGC